MSRVAGRAPNAGVWTARGRQAVWVLTADGRTPYRDGETVPLTAS